MTASSANIGVNVLGSYYERERNRWIALLTLKSFIGVIVNGYDNYCFVVLSFENTANTNVFRVRSDYVGFRYYLSV